MFLSCVWSDDDSSWGGSRIEGDFRTAYPNSLTVHPVPAPTSTNAELKRSKREGGKSQKLMLFKRGKAIRSVIVKALYLLLLYVTIKLRLCHHAMHKSFCMLGVRGTSIVDRTHVLVVERFLSSTFQKHFPMQMKTMAPVEKNFAANCLNISSLCQEILAINPM